ncbi:amidohydrolase family protein [Cloacibacillus sp. An23]|uniref:amidohydrolase family protein n=1 Tax=Cloacibacillus sp. An23 TaxID=1965591 RepID=UPI000B39E0FA|nr:amidohydrolase family protein [Cloacibacillus sp. An23]OUO93769.1 hypothetical protein B5F39_06200 [Cloacibacillus sp. An23]
MLDVIFENCVYSASGTGADSRIDIGIMDGKIAFAAPHGKRSEEAVQTVRCEGLHAFPGFIDFHTHLFAHGSTFGMEADDLLTAGVTRAVDMGTSGWVNYPAFRKCDIEGRRIRIKSFLNVSPVGQPGKGISEPLEDGVISISDMANVIERYPGKIIGLKVRISRNIVRGLGLEPLKKAVEAGEALGLPVCVHTTDPPAPTKEILKILRRGDIYSHMYHGEGETILSAGGRLEPEAFRARERGVLFEVGNGRKNFDFRVAEQAAKEGFFPDLITSDSTRATFHKDESMWDLTFVMSKFLDLGMKAAEVTRSVTETPARLFGLNAREYRLKEGCGADLTFCRISETSTRQYDSYGNERTGKWLIEPVMTVLGGDIVYDVTKNIQE